MSKKFKQVKIICIVLVFTVLALALAVGFFAVNVLRSTEFDDPTKGFDPNNTAKKKQTESVIPPITPDMSKPYKVYSDNSIDGIYLRGIAYGNYDGKTWLPATPFKELIDGKYPASYLSSRYIEENKLADPIALSIDPEYASKILPQYTATEVQGQAYNDEYGIPTDDVSANTIGNDIYSMYFYDYHDTSLKPCTPLPGYEMYESKYRQFVYSQYLNVDSATKSYMKTVIRQQGFSKNDYDVAEDVAKYVKSLGKYKMDYNRELDNEDNVALAFMNDYNEGTCKHFASVATLLFRTLNIPARFVVGYMTEAKAGEWVQVEAVNAHAWVEIYVDGFGWKSVEVTPPRDIPELKLKPVDVYKLYDGTPLLPEQKIEGFEDYEAKGYTYEVVITGERTESGIGESNIESLKLIDPEGTDVTSGFDIYVAPGDIVVYRGIISLKSDDFDHMYNGLAPNSKPELCEAIVIEGEPLKEGETVTIKPVELSYENTDLPYEIGKYPHMFDVSITDAEGQDITVLYKYEYDFGFINITPAKLVLQAASKEQVYNFEDPEPLTCSDKPMVIEGELLLGDKISEWHNIGSQTEPGESENKVDLSRIVITNAKGENVTNRYTLTAKNGTLRVTLEE